MIREAVTGCKLCAQWEQAKEEAEAMRDRLGEALKRQKYGAHKTVDGRCPDCEAADAALAEFEALP